MTVSLALHLRRAAFGATLAAAAAAGGCANDNGPGLFSTGALGDSKPVMAAKPAIDPACGTLASQIDKLNQDGTVGRLEKAADGKTADVTVKRASLATQAQLNKANADFIAKCGPNLPKTAMVAPATPVPAAAQAKVAQAATAKATAAAAAAGPAVKDPGVTVVPPAVATATNSVPKN